MLVTVVTVSVTVTLTETVMLVQVEQSDLLKAGHPPAAQAVVLFQQLGVLQLQMLHVCRPVDHTWVSYNHEALRSKKKREKGGSEFPGTTSGGRRTSQQGRQTHVHSHTKAQNDMH